MTIVFIKSHCSVCIWFGGVIKLYIWEYVTKCFHRKWLSKSSNDNKVFMAIFEKSIYLRYAFLTDRCHTVLLLYPNFWVRIKTQDTNTIPRVHFISMSRVCHLRSLWGHLDGQVWKIIYKRLTTLKMRYEIWGI